jgi:hypothetical protein
MQHYKFKLILTITCIETYISTVKLHDTYRFKYKYTGYRGLYRTFLVMNVSCESGICCITVYEVHQVSDKCLGISPVAEITTGTFFSSWL